MPAKPDETVPLLKEIRDLEREQLSLLRADKLMSEHEEKMHAVMYGLRLLSMVVIGAFVIGAFWYFYHTLYGTGLLTGTGMN